MPRIADMKIPFLILNSVMWKWYMRHDPGCMRELMSRYWNVLLFLCGVTILLSVVFALWSIVSPWTPTTDAAPISRDNPDTLRREQMQLVIDLYGQRKLQHDKVKNAPPTITDPS